MLEIKTVGFVDDNPTLIAPNKSLSVVLWRELVAALPSPTK